MYAYANGVSFPRSAVFICAAIRSCGRVPYGEGV